MVVEMGAFKTGSIRRLVPADAAVGRPDHRRRRHAPRTLRLDSTRSCARRASWRRRFRPAACWWSTPTARARCGSPEAPTALPRAAVRRNIDRRAGDAARETSASRSRARRSCCDTRDRAYTCFTPLLGRPIILNLAGAFTLATALGVDPEVAVAAFRTLKPVSNRLEVVEERGVTWIRDAYNSNQFGFRAALEVAAALPAARRFLATPGVIELGPRAVRRQPRAVARSVAGLRQHARRRPRPTARRSSPGIATPGAKLAWWRSPIATEAFRWLRETLHDGDAVILENDLPDLYERSAGVFWKAARDGRHEPSRPTPVAVLFGGRSLEHDVSVVSGLQILHALDPERFAPMPIYIDQATALVDRRRSLAHRNVQGRRPRSLAADRSDALAGLRHLDAGAGRAAAAGRRSARARGARSIPSMCSFRFCTARSARTAASRGCSNSAAARTSAAACWRRRSGMNKRADEDRGRARRRAGRAVAVVRARRCSIAGRAWLTELPAHVEPIASAGR